VSSSEPGYFSAYENFALERSGGGVLTVRFHTDGGPAVFTGTTHHDFPRLIEDGQSLGDLTKPMNADVLHVEGRRGIQRLVTRPTCLTS